MVALGNLVGVLRQAKRLRRLPTDFKVGGVHHEVAEVVGASRFEQGLIAVLALQDSVLISKFCIGKIGHFNKREKENGLAHEI